MIELLSVSRQRALVATQSDQNLLFVPFNIVHAVHYVIFLTSRGDTRLIHFNLDVYGCCEICQMHIVSPSSNPAPFCQFFFVQVGKSIAYISTPGRSIFIVFLVFIHRGGQWRIPDAMPHMLNKIMPLLQTSSQSFSVPLSEAIRTSFENTDTVEALEVPRE